MIEITQAVRDAAADLLDELSSILDHNGIGQVADLIRDSEYDDHEAVKAFAKFEAAAYAAGVAAERERIDTLVSKYQPSAHWCNEMNIAIGETVRNRILDQIRESYE